MLVLGLEHPKWMSEYQTWKTQKISQMDILISNGEDLDQTAFEDCFQSDLGLHCLSRLFWQTTDVRNFGTFTVILAQGKKSRLKTGVNN